VDQRTRDNWLTVKEALEKAGKTDCFFYKRALMICRGDKDPLDEVPITGT
jgi:hypothetical protein